LKEAEYSKFKDQIMIKAKSIVIEHDALEKRRKNFNLEMSRREKLIEDREIEISRQSDLLREAMRQLKE
jgi:hypothetical protein